MHEYLMNEVLHKVRFNTGKTDDLVHKFVIVCSNDTNATPFRIVTDYVLFA